MRTWRALKAAGAGLLRDGAYLLPNSDLCRAVLEEQAAEIKAAGGLVHLLSFDADSSAQQAGLVRVFERAHEYAEAIGRLEPLAGELARLDQPAARPRPASLARTPAASAAPDLFSR